MNRIYTFIFILVTIFSVTNIFAQTDHLEPVEGIFTIPDFQVEYYSKVRDILFKDLSDYPEFRFFVFPSTGLPNVLNIELNHDTKKYYILYHIANKNIWITKKRRKIKVTKRKKEISKESVDLIKGLYKTAISKTKYIEKDYFEIHGINYYFSINDSIQKSGKTWNPTFGTMMAELVIVGNELIKMTEEEEDLVSLNQDLRIRIENLIQKLKTQQ